MNWRSFARGCGAAAGAMAMLAALPAGASETQTYTYDAKGRLIVKKSTGTANNNQTHSYCYDKAGNRITYSANQTGAPHTCVTDGTPQLIIAGSPVESGR